MTKVSVHSGKAEKEPPLYHEFVLRPNYLRKSGTLPNELKGLSLFPWIAKMMIVAFLLYRFFAAGYLNCKSDNNLEREYVETACATNRFLTRDDNTTDFGLNEKTDTSEILRVGNSWPTIMTMILGAVLFALPTVFFKNLEIERRLYEIAGVLERIPHQSEDRRFRTFHEAVSMLGLLIQRKSKIFFIKYMICKHLNFLVIPIYNLVLNGILDGAYGGLFSFSNYSLFKKFPLKALCSYRINVETEKGQFNVGESVTTCEMPVNPTLATGLYIDRFLTTCIFVTGIFLALKDILWVVGRESVSKTTERITKGYHRRESEYQKYCASHPAWDGFFLDRFSAYVQSDVFEDVVRELNAREEPLRK